MGAASDLGSHSAVFDRGFCRPPTDGASPTDHGGDTKPSLAPPAYDFPIPPQSPDELGRLGPYRALRLLGRGGMGQVFEAEDTRLQRPVALKVLHPAQAGDDHARERFLRECRAASAIHHENVVMVHDIGEEQGTPYLVMELLHGYSLEWWIQANPNPTLHDIICLGKQIVAGLAAAHSCNVIHRDVKPANVFLLQAQPDSQARGEGSKSSEPSSVEPHSSIGRVKLLDFGLARANDAVTTQVGVILGTPAYMSPEQARGAAVDARADLFSLGCILYRLCTGAAPFAGPDAMAVLTALAVERPKPIADSNPGVLPGLEHLIMRLLAKDPARRPASAVDVELALQRCEEELDQPPARRRRLPLSRWWIAAGLLAIAITPAMAWFGPTIIRFATDRGEIVVETDDPQLSMKVAKAGVVLEDASSGRRYNLSIGARDVRSGAYAPCVRATPPPAWNSIRPNSPSNAARP